MRTVKCNLCKEPAWNFTCVSCAGSDTREFLPKEIIKEFDIFHKDFCERLDAPLELKGSVTCIKCDSTKDLVCPQCYSNEVYNWLEDRDAVVAERFARIFSFGSLNDTLASAGQKEDFGICDECGEYTEDLVVSDGEWVCRECAVYD